MTDSIRLPKHTPTADGFQLAVCDDPGCGVHIVSKDEAGRPICVTVISQAQMLELIGDFRDILAYKRKTAS